MLLSLELWCRSTRFGEVVALVGSSPTLGQWNPFESPVRFVTTPQLFPLWKLSSIELSERDEFKCVIINPVSRQVRWEQGFNRQLPPQCADYVEAKIKMRFDDTSFFQVVEFTHKHNSCGSAPGPVCPVPFDGRVSDAVVAQAVGGGLNWVGREVEFVRSRSQLKRVEDAATGPGPTSDKLASLDVDPFTMPFLEGMVHAHSYLDKLQLVTSHIERVGAAGPTDEQVATLLSTAAVYLNLIRSGAIPCRESGGHYRPNHHANCAVKIFTILRNLRKKRRECRSLDQENRSNKAGARSDALTLICRRIIPTLPSFNGKFTCNVPLTRIRDLAHRNDIPPHIKTEIKHTLQNKLHRSAGPEDLVTAEKFREKLVGCNEAFRREYDLFLDELREFFNAKGLRESLIELQQQVLRSPDLVQQITDLIQLMGCLDRSTTSDEELLSVLKLAASVRRELQIIDASHETAVLADLQLVAQCDVGLELVVFAVVSRIFNASLERSLEGALVSDQIRLILRTMALCLEHAALSGFQAEECECIMNSILALIDKSKSVDGTTMPDENRGPTVPEPGHTECSAADTPEDFALFAYAVAARLQSLVDNFCALILRIYPMAAGLVGAACGVADYIVDQFAESDIRASLFFQLAKSGSWLLQKYGSRSNGVEVIVEGTKERGRVVLLDDLWELANHGSGGATVPDIAGAGPDEGTSREKLLVVLKRATGDEEIAGLKCNFGVTGIILLHAIPHLSHLSIRARQEQVPFVCVTDTGAPDLIKQVQQLVGSVAELDFEGPEGVDLKPYGGSVEWEAPHPQSLSEVSAAPPLAPVRAFTKKIIPGEPLRAVHENLAPEVVGAKAYACSRLSQLALSSEGSFRAPKCWVLPYGSMEQALTNAEKYEAYEILARKIARLLISRDAPEPEKEHILSQLRALIVDLRATAEDLRPLVDLLRQWKMREPTSFVVRSSASVEDLPGQSAAGLFESILNVDPTEDFGKFSAAISAVWASLYSKRAMETFALQFHSPATPHIGPGPAISSTALETKTTDPLLYLPQMAVLVQDIAARHADLSFVMHTRAPVGKSGDRHNWIYVEAAVGLGEILTSVGIPGGPFRAMVHKKTHTVEMLAFASFPVKFVANSAATKPVSLTAMSSSSGPTKVGTVPEATSFVDTETVDYVKDPFSMDCETRRTTLRMLAEIAVILEKDFGGPQDVEGVVTFKETGKGVKDICLVQTRPQPGV